MPLLNYTTQISADKTIGEIQKCLAVHGARAILCEYSDEALDCKELWNTNNGITLCKICHEKITPARWLIAKDGRTIAEHFEENSNRLLGSGE